MRDEAQTILVERNPQRFDIGNGAALRQVRASRSRCNGASRAPLVQEYRAVAVGGDRACERRHIGGIESGAARENDDDRSAAIRGVRQFRVRGRKRRLRAVRRRGGGRTDVSERENECRKPDAYLGKHVAGLSRRRDEPLRVVFAPLFLRNEPVSVDRNRLIGNGDDDHRCVDLEQVHLHDTMPRRRSAKHDRTRYLEAAWHAAESTNGMANQ